MQGHGFTRRPRNMRGKIRGGAAVGCTGCAWMTVLPLGTPVPQMLKAHHDHLAEAPPAPAPAADVRSELAELAARFTAVTGG